MCKKDVENEIVVVYFIKNGFNQSTLLIRTFLLKFSHLTAVFWCYKKKKEKNKNNI